MLNQFKCLLGQLHGCQVHRRGLQSVLGRRQTRVEWRQPVREAHVQVQQKTIILIHPDHKTQY